MHAKYSAFRSHRESSPWSPYANAHWKAQRERLPGSTSSSQIMDENQYVWAVRPAVKTTSDFFQVLTALADWSRLNMASRLFRRLTFGVRGCGGGSGGSGGSGGNNATGSCSCALAGWVALVVAAFVVCDDAAWPC
jgi:hypothetical protein